MELKDVASVSGKGGLFKVLKPTRNGVILEAIDETRKKLIAGQSQQVSLLKEISLYTHTAESSVPLETVLKKIKTQYGNSLPVTSKSEPQDLKSFIESVVPEYDREKVYPSDLKKLVSWYEILLKFAPEILTSKVKEEGAAIPAGQTEAAGKSSKPDKKPSAGKTATAKKALPETEVKKEKSNAPEAKTFPKEKEAQKKSGIKK